MSCEKKGASQPTSIRTRATHKCDSSIARGEAFVAAFALFGAVAVPAIAATIYQAVMF